MKIPHGYVKDSERNISIVEKEADTIRLIFHLYLNGMSLGKIRERLAEKFISSPTGKPTWTRAAIDDVFSKPKYIPLVGMDTYIAANHEKQTRSNIDEEAGKRKATRYSSKEVSGDFQISTIK